MRDHSIFFFLSLCLIHTPGGETEIKQMFVYTVQDCERSNKKERGRVFVFMNVCMCMRACLCVHISVNNCSDECMFLTAGIIDESMVTRP